MKTQLQIPPVMDYFPEQIFTWNEQYYTYAANIIPQINRIDDS